MAACARTVSRCHGSRIGVRKVPSIPLTLPLFDALARLSNRWGIPYLETSAKTDIKVNDVSLADMFPFCNTQVRSRHGQEAARCCCIFLQQALAVTAIYQH